jgi:hypothetical protein
MVESRNEPKVRHVMIYMPSALTPQKEVLSPVIDESRNVPIVGCIDHKRAVALFLGFGGQVRVDVVQITAASSVVPAKQTLTSGSSYEVTLILRSLKCDLHVAVLCLSKCKNSICVGKQSAVHGCEGQREVSVVQVSTASGVVPANQTFRSQDCGPCLLKCKSAVCLEKTRIAQLRVNQG